MQRYGSLSIYTMWRPSAILDSFDAYWDHPPTMLVRFYCCAKLRLNRYNSLHNMKVSAFFAFALKMSIRVPKIILGIVLPKWRISSLPTHKKYFVAQKLIWRGPMHRWSLNDTFCCIYRAVESPSVFNGLEKTELACPFPWRISSPCNTRFLASTLSPCQTAPRSVQLLGGADSCVNQQRDRHSRSLASVTVGRVLCCGMRPKSVSRLNWNKG